MVKVTKLPPGPSENDPIVGKLYSVHNITDLACYCKFPNESWKDERDVMVLVDLLRSVPYVLLTHFNQNEEEVWIEGRLLVAQKFVDFWVPYCGQYHPEIHETCTDLWKTYFIPATMS